MKNKILMVSAVTGLSAFFYTVSFAQKGYVVHGDIQGLNEPYLYLSRPAGDSAHIDSAKVVNGKFTFTGSVNEPTQAVIMNKEQSKGFQLYLENSNITVTGKADSLRRVKITGSATQKDVDDLKSATTNINKQEQELYAKYKEAESNKDTASQKLYEQQFDSLNNASTAINKQFIKDHPKSFVSLGLLQQIAYGMNYNDLNTSFNSLDASVKNSSKGKKYAEHLALMGKITEGNPAIPFTQNDVNGKPVSLSDFKGKYVLVDFWASWCGPCRAENPNVVKAYNKYKDKNFTVLGVSLDQSADSWKEAIAKDNLTWTEVSDLKYWKNEAAAKYGIQAIPANFLIDPNGIIIGHNLRGDDLDNKLAEVLK
ncbi:MAG: TlpA disulfide reductase family protein [Arachidicoccus sp.]|nr:TlpA disulfide reductase family protein [Arachidicoccus sp.]